MESPPTGRRIQEGYVNINDFRPIYRYISEAVQGKAIGNMQA